MWIELQEAKERMLAQWQDLREIGIELVMAQRERLALAAAINNARSNYNMTADHTDYENALDEYFSKRDESIGIAEDLHRYNELLKENDRIQQQKEDTDG